MTEIKLEDKDGALVFKEDYSIEIIMPNYENDEDVVPEVIQLMAAVGILLNSGEEKFINYIWKEWEKMMEGIKTKLEKKMFKDTAKKTNRNGKRKGRSKYSTDE